MAMNDVIINRLTNTNGGTAQGFSHYSSMMFYGTAPSVTGKWATYVGTTPNPNIKAQQIFSSDDATSAGILPYTENTAPSATYVLSVGAAGAGETCTIAITFPKPNGTTEVETMIYTTVAGDTVVDVLGANLVIFINTYTVTNGISASYNAGTNTLTITAPKSAGVSLNTGVPLAITNSGTVAGVITQFSAGTASQYAVWKYQIDEFFRKFPTGNVWVGIIASSSSFNEIQTLNEASGKKIRQLAVYDIDATRGAAANITATILSVDTACKKTVDKFPFVTIYSPNIKAVSDLSTYTDQNLNTASSVQCVISQDGDAAGALLFVQAGQTVGNCGVKLATIANSRVSASDAQITEDFNLTDGVENFVPAFGNGLLNTSVSGNLQTQLNDYNYTFFRTWGDSIVGTYWNDNRCCVVQTSDFAHVNDNRVIGEVQRTCYQTYVPLLNSEVIFNSDGTLSAGTIATFQNAGEDAITNAMITGFGALPLISGVTVTIDASQKVKTTKNLIVNVTIDENGIARTITVNVGYRTL